MYGYSSVFYLDIGRIFIYGGYKMRNSICFKIFDEIFYYQRDRKKWYFRYFSGVSRYFYFVVFVGGIMIVLGGRGDSGLVLSQIMVFDIGKCIIDGIFESFVCNVFFFL